MASSARALRGVSRDGVDTTAAEHAGDARSNGSADGCGGRAVCGRTCGAGGMRAANENAAQYDGDTWLCSDTTPAAANAWALNTRAVYLSKQNVPSNKHKNKPHC